MGAEEVFEFAESHAKDMLEELEARYVSPELAASMFEQAVGVLVLLCVAQGKTTAADKINHFLADVPWRLTACAS